MIAINASRQDLHDFQAWLKRQPWTETRFLYQTYMRQEDREKKLKEFFELFLIEKNTISNCSKPTQ